jgi:hypothetical protein
VFENRVLRRIFGPKRDEVTGVGQNCTIRSFITCAIGRICSTNGDKRNGYRILVGKPEGRRPLGRPRRRWIGNIKMDLTEIGCDDMDWIHLAQDRDQWRALVNMVMNLRVP